MLLPVKLEEGMSVAMLFVLQILVEQSESFRGTCRQGRGQVIQVEPAHIEAFLITDKWLDIASRLQSAQERMIHVHGVVAIGVCDYLVGRSNGHQIGDDGIDPGLFLMP